MIFDLDGPLVQTEKLKARSYARAAVVLCPDEIHEDVLEAYKDVVGLSRQDVASALVTRFELQKAAANEHIVIDPGDLEKILDHVIHHQKGR